MLWSRQASEKPKGVSLTFDPDTYQGGEEEEKVERSVRAVFAAREVKYRVLADGTRQDLWMSGSMLEAAVNLQKLGASLQHCQVMN